ncbi:MAG: 3-dehydro-L-gulonate 2-dehydrogenase [Peptococcales bacterium]|jgi:3-dehydro-L-gulonate 2-dehydrogenase
MRIKYEKIQNILTKKLQSRGCSYDQSVEVGREIARNSLEGNYTHGINRFARLIRNIDEGIVIPNVRPTLVSGFEAIERYDGNLGLGVSNALFTMKRAIELAKRYGIGLVALKNTNHWMRAATYGYQACEAGLAGMCFTNTMPNMPTWGAIDSRIGNNPFVMAFPRSNGIHLIVDSAMSQFSYGALELARLEGRTMPIDAGFDESGNLTKDPNQVIKSQRILPMGYWKGAGISFIIDIFASCISVGNSVCEVGKLVGDEHGVSQIFIAINYTAISQEKNVAQILENAIEDLKKSQPIDKNQPIVFAGERMVISKRENESLGIPVDEHIWNEILSL